MTASLFLKTKEEDKLFPKKGGVYRLRGQLLGACETIGGVD